MGEKLSQILYDLKESHSIVKKMLSRLCVVERELNSCFTGKSSSNNCGCCSKNKCRFDKRN